MTFRSCLQIAKVIVRQVFTYGSVLDAGGILSRVLQTPEIRELALVRRDKSEKEWKIMNAVMENLRDYLSRISKTKSTRKTLSERAFRTVVAACSGQNLRDNRLIQTLCRELVSNSLRAHVRTQTFIPPHTTFICRVCIGAR